MIPRFSLLRPLLFTLGLVLAGGEGAYAAPPAAPTDVKLEFTRGAAGDFTGASTTFRITWKDNAVNEEGYRVEARLGTTAAFEGLVNLSPNSDILVVPLQTQVKDTVIQFRVAVFQQNGGQAEVSFGPIVSHTFTEAAATFGAPTGLTAELLTSGVVKMKWTDNSNSELFYQVMNKKSSETAFAPLGFLHFNTVELPLQGNLIPGQQYDFFVRATRHAPANGDVGVDPALVTGPSNTVTVTIPALAPPANLSGVPAGEDSVKLQWEDKSGNETSFRVERKQPGETTFTSIGSVGANITTATVPVLPLATTTWRVIAVYENSELTTAIESAPSNEVQVATEFRAPSQLVATTSPKAKSVELEWKDNSSAEFGYEIMLRTGSQDFHRAILVPSGTTTATVSYIEPADGSGKQDLAVGTSYDFAVRAVYGTATSALSNISTATTKEGFTSRFYHPATKGTAMDAMSGYAMKVSVPVTMNGALKNWNVTGLSAVGLSFDNDSGIITGTPTAAGVFKFPMTATFADGWVASTELTMRIRQPQLPPTSSQIGSLTIATGATFTIPLAGKFTDVESEEAVRMETTMGNIDILLYPSLTPEAVENFLAYVDAGDYDGVAFHRSLPSFIIQGGGFRPVATPNIFQSVPSRTSPRNEPGISNVTGTIASAKVGGNPHSATHDFFFNMANNNSADPESLDNQNGGFTAFGRVSTPSLEVLQDIEDLPTRDYVNLNDQEPYDPAKDKRVVVDGSLSGFEDWPMAGGTTAPADMDVNRTVRITRARRIAPVSLSVGSNSAPSVVSATLSGTNLQIRGLKAGSSTLTVKMTDLDGLEGTQSFTVTVAPNYRPPVITSHPVSLAVVAGSKATFKVTATGTALKYDWRKDGISTGVTTPTLVIDDVQSGHLGFYDVRVSNDTTSVISNPARLAFPAIPKVLTESAAQVVEVGEPLNVEITMEGAPEPKVVWQRSGRNVAGQTKAKLTIPSAKLTDAGLYTATITNTLGKDTSDEIAVFVIDPATVLTTAKPKSKVTLKAGAAGPGLTYQWLKDGEPLEDGGRIAGAQTATLTITQVTLDEPSDSGAYTCEVSAPGLGTEETGVQQLAVVTRPSIENYTADTAAVGFDYDFVVPYDDSPEHTPTKFEIYNLPPGLRGDAKTGRITGRPLVAGTFAVTTLLRNLVGHSVAVGTFEVLPMSQAGVGTFAAGVTPEEWNANLGGRIDLTALDSGNYSGRLILGGITYPFVGKMTYLPGVYAPQGTVEIQRRGKTPVTLSFVIAESSGDLSGQLTDGVGSSSVVGFRKSWDTDWNAFPFSGLYNMSMNVSGSDVGNTALPQGSGFISMIVGTGGYTNLSIRLADGTLALANSVVGNAGQFLIYQSVYRHTGSIVGAASLSSTNTATDATRVIRVDGTAKWIKAPQTLASERSYKAGFGPMQLTVFGSSYTHPTGGKLILGLPEGDQNLSFDFSQGGLTSSNTNPDVTLSLKKHNAPKFPTPGSLANPGKVRLSIYGNGFYSGSFELSEPGVKAKRTANFQGLLISKIPVTPAVAATSTTAARPEVPGADPSGVGFFLLPQLPGTGTTLATSPILSGKVVMKPAGITITTQPLGQQVDPGANVTFTVAATGQGTLTYQWRKDGTSISSATGSSLTVSAVAEAQQGSYDVVVSNGAISVTSEPAALDVKNAITSVTVTRTPSEAVVATGKQVIFSAATPGSGPLTYQWRKDGVDIPDATEATYTIASVNAADHAGNYSVKIVNSVTPAGLVSADSNLAVADGVTDVQITSTPSPAQLQAGESITFSVTASGAGPLTYQWRKNEQNINGATTSTYTIPQVVGADAGTYDVVVKNEATPNGLASASITMTVANGDTVVASRLPATEYVLVGATVEFTVSVPTSEEPWNYQWRKNGIEIPGANGPTYSVAVGEADDESAWDVVISNTTNPGQSSNAVPVRVQAPISNTTVVVDPAGPVPANTSVTFTVVASGTGPFSYQWRKGGSNISDATGSTYTIPGVTSGHGGSYDVVVSNAVSSETSISFTLEVVEN